MSDLAIPVNNADHTQGSPDAKNTIVHYGDFQCPDSYNGYEVIRKLQEDTSQDILYIFRHFPLEKHDNAFSAAQASEIAGESWMFWEMYNILFQNQQNLSDEALAVYAAEMGIDAVEFLQKLHSGDGSFFINACIAGGEKSWVSGTPTFFINGERYDMSHGEGSLALGIAAKLL